MFTANITANNSFSTPNIAAQHNLSSVNYRYHHLEKEKKTRKVSVGLSSFEFSEDEIKKLVNDINELLED